VCLCGKHCTTSSLAPHVAIEHVRRFAFRISAFKSSVVILLVYNKPFLDITALGISLPQQLSRRTSQNTLDTGVLLRSLTDMPLATLTDPKYQHILIQASRVNLSKRSLKPSWKRSL
jgi:hypothetical protein